MSVANTPTPEEVEQLLLNAHLRDELEPYEDEAIESVHLRRLPIKVENEFLASMLAWERAPMLPIHEWFEPALELPHPETLGNQQITRLLLATVERLFENRIVLDFTDHLSDRELYTLILRDILPTPEKMIVGSDHYLHWDCTRDSETWLRYYASEEERMAWAGELCTPLPPHDTPPHRRQLPRRPL
jgi:hypothetical protein